MKAFNFAVLQRGNDVHNTLFDTLKILKNHDFDLKNKNCSKITFCTLSDKIFVRSPIKPKGIPSREENLNVSLGTSIKGVVTLSQLKQCYFSKEEIMDFTVKHQREPTKTEAYPYILLEGDRLNRYIEDALCNAGLNLKKYTHVENGYRYYAKARKSFKAIDVMFEATISDLEKFEDAWFKGIGRNKTIGFGMLRVVVNEK